MCLGTVLLKGLESQTRVWHHDKIQSNMNSGVCLFSQLWAAVDTNDALSKTTIQSNGFLPCVTQKKLTIWYREIRVLVATKEVHECSSDFGFNLKLNLDIIRYYNLL